MNILMIERSLHPNMGGVQRVVWTLANELKRRGHEVFFAYTKQDYDEIPILHKIHYEENKTEEYYYPLFSEFMEKNKIDVAIIHRFQSDLAAFQRIKMEHRCKFVVFYHGSDATLSYPRVSYERFIYDMKKSLKNMFKYSNERLIIRNLKDMVHFVYTKGINFLHRKERIGVQLQLYRLSERFGILSPSFKEPIVKKFGLEDGKKVIAIPNSLPYSNKVDENCLEGKQNIVLMVTRLEERMKRVTLALRIWSEIEKTKRFENWSFQLVGFGDDEQYILEYAKRLKLKQFEFFGRSNHPESFYLKSKIFLMTSNEWEGFGLTLIESSLFGCVPMAFDSYASLHDILEDGRNGIIVPNNDVKFYSQKLARLMSDDEERIRLARNAMENSQRFKSEEIGNKWEVMLKEVMAE